MMNLVYTYQPLFDYFLLAVGFAYSQQMVLRAGVFSIGSAGFASIGAYGVGILVKDHGANPIVCGTGLNVVDRALFAELICQAGAAFLQFCNRRRLGFGTVAGAALGRQYE